MFLRSLNTNEKDWAPLFARVALGVMMFPHGAGKLMGWFGGHGFQGTMAFFTESMGIPWIFAFLAIIAEFFGGLGLITGTLTRLSAIGVGITMAVAAIQVHIAHGFFMNWMGNQEGEGIEFHILAVGLALAVAISGGGRFAADTTIKKALSTKGDK